MISTFIDESGSFVAADNVGSWNVTAAAVLPNPELRKCVEALRTLKVSAGKRFRDEVKLKDVSESTYLVFLSDLTRTGLTLYAVAADGGQQDADNVAVHRDMQAEKIEENVPRMTHPEGKKMVQELANQVRKLSPQLHLQLVCQSELLYEVVSQAIMYYVQRCPAQLNNFRWRIDEKAPGTNNFEDVFRKVVPALLQSKSFRNPMPHVKEFDYSAMNGYRYTSEDAPTYLNEHYGMDIDAEGSLNIGRLIWDDFSFVDSKGDLGVQIVDLLASGIRRCIRGDFQQNDEISSALGRLMVQTAGDGFPMRFITIAGNERGADDISARAANRMKRSQLAMLV